jgi:DnaJ-class molecular chaperone
MDIFKMANQIANNMSEEDKQNMESMDMEKMISHVTKNLFKMMNEDNHKSEDDVESIKQSLPKTRDICFDLNVDLEDFYTGKKKKLNVKRKTISNGKVIEEKKKLVIPIEKGMKDEQQIKFEEEADEIPGYEQGDIVINLIENEHPIFQRDGDNLIIVKNINLYEIYNLSFDIKHLDGRIIRIEKDPSDALHLNESLRKISGEGMPKYKSNGEYGDLFIRFNIVIPKILESSKLKILKDLFDKDLQQTDNSVFIKKSENIDKKYVLENISDIEDSDYSDYSEESSEYEEEEVEYEEEEVECSESEPELEPEPEPEPKKKYKKT